MCTTTRREPSVMAEREVHTLQSYREACAVWALETLDLEDLLYEGDLYDCWEEIEAGYSGGRPVDEVMSELFAEDLAREAMDADLAAQSIEQDDAGEEWDEHEQQDQG